MARSLSQIYSEAVAKRNDYLQLTELNSGKTDSKLSILNLLSYNMASLIFTYETVLDVFQADIADLLSRRINGTPAYYVEMAKKFQYNPITGDGDEVYFNEDTMTLSYIETDVTKRIIAQAAYEEFSDGSGMYLKVCKDNTDTEKKNGNLYVPLNTTELSAFMNFIKQIKFVGTKIICQSIPGDILRISNCEVVYNDTYITQSQVYAKLQSALIGYASNLKYNGYIYYQDIIDALQKEEYIISISANTVVTIQSYNSSMSQYRPESIINNRAKAESGYVKFIDEEGDSTITQSSFTFIKNSEL